MRVIVIAAIMVLSLLTTRVDAQQTADASLEVQHAWARASAGTTGAAYFSIVNRGSAPDRLLAIKTAVAAKAELHENKMEDGVMKMRPIGPITIGPGMSAVLKPGADHVMLIGLAHPLKEGESFSLTLSFERVGEVQVPVRVQRAGAMGADAADHGSMQNMHGGGMDSGDMK